MSEEQGPPTVPEPAAPLQPAPTPQMGPYSPPPPRPSGARVGKGILISCSVLMLLALLLIVVLASIMQSTFKRPEVQRVWQEYYRDMGDMAACQSNLSEIGGALERYRIANRRFPERLEQLAPTFLKSRKMLFCPSDRENPSGTSYTYYPPTDKTPDDETVVVCNRHHIPGGTPMNLVLLKDGTIRQEH